MFLFYQMAAEISKPLCDARKVTMVSSGDGQVGAAKLSGEVLAMMTRIPEALEKLTGVSISQVTRLLPHRVFVLPLPCDLSAISAVGELRCGRPRWAVGGRQTHFLAAPWTAGLSNNTNTFSFSTCLIRSSHCGGGHKLHFLLFILSSTCKNGEIKKMNRSHYDFFSTF